MHVNKDICNLKKKRPKFYFFCKYLISNIKQKMVLLTIFDAEITDKLIGQLRHKLANQIADRCGALKSDGGAEKKVNKTSKLLQEELKRKKVLQKYGNKLITKHILSEKN